ncbi:hypothetical protein [Streptomyces diastaticus]|uniref:hypothetical protein n=1 Tax=Streptomyces diastaticus TaxID=1956 RepID=UPI003827CEE6
MATAGTGQLAGIGARPIPEFDGVHDVWPRGERLRAVREAASAYKERFKAQGRVHAVKSVDIAAAPRSSTPSTTPCRCRASL